MILKVTTDYISKIFDKKKKAREKGDVVHFPDNIPFEKLCCFLLHFQKIHVYPELDFILPFQELHMLVRCNQHLTCEDLKAVAMKMKTFGATWQVLGNLACYGYECRHAPTITPELKASIYCYKL